MKGRRRAKDPIFAAHPSPNSLSSSHGRISPPRLPPRPLSPTNWRRRRHSALINGPRRRTRLPTRPNLNLDE